MTPSSGKGVAEGVRTAVRTGLRIAADGSYAARLVMADSRGRHWFTERWTLHGPEPYAVPLPADRPEGPDSEVLPLPDGRVLIRRPADGGHRLALLYPAGAGTGELAVGAVACGRLTLLPPPPGPSGRVYALAPGGTSTTVWLVHGGTRGPERVAEVPGHCSGGVWLDDCARLLAVDRTDPRGRTKTVAVDLDRGGEVTPLLQISEDSDDRLLLADPGSGLLLLRSDAPGAERLGWGVLGSHRPVRFPEALHPRGVRLTPFAVQCGQVLQPESCAVALRADGPGGCWIALWRPAGGLPGGPAGGGSASGGSASGGSAGGGSAGFRSGGGCDELRQLPAPDGWLPGAGRWAAGGTLWLPYANRQTPCGLARLVLPEREPAPAPIADAARQRSAAGGAGRMVVPRPAARRPVPLRLAPLVRVARVDRQRPGGDDPTTAQRRPAGSARP